MKILIYYKYLKSIFTNFGLSILTIALPHYKSTITTILHKLFDFLFFQKLSGTLTKYLIPDYCKRFDLHKRLINKLLSTNYFKDKFGEELEKERENLQNSLWKGFVECYDKLPEQGLSKQNIIDKMENYIEKDKSSLRMDRMSGASYSESNHDDLVSTIVMKYIKCNNLHFTTWQNSCRMEIEIGKFLCNFYNGGPGSRGCWCPGGSYSNIVACYCAREHAYKENFIKQPEMIMCINGHPSLEKGGHITKMLVHKVDTGSDYRIDVGKVLSLINSNTALVALSAPSYPRGVIDDIETIAKVCYSRNIWVHVDACIGSLIVPFLRENNFPVYSRFDFTVEGVNSISCDTHKYGLGPKGASYILYRSLEKFKYATYYTTDWDGGILPSVSFEGSKPGSILAATWAVMMHMGREGYRQNSFRIREKVDYLKREVKKILPLYVQGSCDAMIVAVGCKSNKYTIFNVRDLMQKKKWYLKELQNPIGFHIAITNNNINQIEDLISELKEAVATLEKMTPSEIVDMGSSSQMYAMKASVSGGFKLDIGLDIALDIMSSTGMIEKEIKMDDDKDTNSDKKIIDE